MIVVALASAVIWRLRCRAPWKWFWIGAAVWAAAIVGKIGWQLAVDQFLLKAMKADFIEPVYHVVGGAYVGIMSAVWEMGLTAAIALRWRSMTHDPCRAAGVGVGAGAFEAALPGLAALVTAAAVIVGVPGGEAISAAYASSAELNWAPWLLGPVERVIAIVCHTSSRMLVLIAIAKRRWWPFALGFVLFAALDGVAGFALLSGFLGKHSTWIFEAAVLPFAIVSVPIIAWCHRHWPVPVPDSDAAPTDGQ